MIVVCLPIALESREAIASSLINKYGMDYVFLGEIFYDKTTNETCHIAIYNRQRVKDNCDSEFIDLFQSLQNKLSPTILEQIDNCQQIVYLTFHDVGYDNCLKIAKFASIFLSIGGVAVKVVSTGIVREKDKWLGNYNSEDVFDLYSLFVKLEERDDLYCSCGMNNFGKADVSIDITEDAGLAIYVMNVFNYYRLTESVILKDEQTFQPDIECPVYKMHWSECSKLHSDRFYNSYGRWHLSRVAEELNISYQIN